MANRKTSSKKSTAKKTVKRKAAKKAKVEPVNPQITDAVTVIEAEGKVYSIETPTVESTTEPTPEPTPVPETTPTTEETTTVTASYSEITAPSNKDNAVLYIAAALGIILLAWMLVL